MKCYMQTAILKPNKSQEPSEANGQKPKAKWSQSHKAKIQKPKAK